MAFTRVATPADLERVARAHAAAALLAIESGFDAVELHLGHNYLASAFLSGSGRSCGCRWCCVLTTP